MFHSNQLNKHDFLLKLEDIKDVFPRGMMRPYYQSFHINRLEQIRPTVLGRQFPYRKTVTEFLFVTQGSTVRGKGIGQFEVVANSFFFVPAHQIRTVSSLSDDIRKFFCHFDTAIFNPFFRQPDVLSDFPLHYTGDPLIRIPGEAMSRITYLMQRLEAEYQCDSPHEFRLLATYMLTLFF